MAVGYDVSTVCARACVCQATLAHGAPIPPKCIYSAVKTESKIEVLMDITVFIISVLFQNTSCESVFSVYPSCNAELNTDLRSRYQSKCETYHTLLFLKGHWVASDL